MRSQLSLRNPAVIIVAYISIVIGMFAIGAYYYVNTLKVRVATETARSFDASLVTIQDFYSNEIVPRATNAGIELSHDYHQTENTIPFPATFTMDVGNQFERTVPGLNATLYSSAPFPWRQDRKLDAFEKESIDNLSVNPDSAFIRVEDRDGRPTLRYASAVILKESCVGCHNLPKFRFGNTWQVGDFRGVRQISVPLPQSVDLDYEFYAISGSFMLIAALIGGAIVFPLVVRLDASLAESLALTSELETRNRELQEQSEAKDAFLANMSHELRTPLNAILGFSDMLRNQVFGPLGNEKYNEYIEGIHRGGKHLQLMIEDLLDLSRIERGELPLTESEIKLSDLWSEVETLTRSTKIGVSGISLTGDFPSSLPRLRADKRALSQILINLIMNAVQHSSGTEIKVNANVEDGGIVIRVCDDGVGIAAEDIIHLRDRFYRGDKSRLNAEGGLGIGLSLVDVFVSLHGGSLEVESKPGDGASFIVRFPSSRTIAAT